MHRTVLVRRGVPLLLATSLLTACSAGHGDTASQAPGTATATPGGNSSTAGAGSTGSTGSPGSPTANPSGSTAYPTTPAEPGAAVPEVRDAFAVLQATYNDGCTTPGNCRYFLTRVLTNLDDLGNSMKASPKGHPHFSDPIARIGRMQTALGGDFSFANLTRHKSLLVGTRDKVNTWMQSHPEDYR